MDGTLMEKTLVLFTTTYPYAAGAEQTFLEGELRHLRSAFGRVILIPDEVRGKRLPLPEGIEVDESHAATQMRRLARIRRLLAGARSMSLVREIRRRPDLVFRPGLLKRALTFFGRAKITDSWLDGFMAAHTLIPADTVLYTYWFFSTSLGLACGRARHPGLVLVSRAHGYDLYEERHESAYIPGRAWTLPKLDAVLPDSEAGELYLRSRYNEQPRICETLRLGVPDPGFRSRASDDGIFRLVSCSLLVPVKRIPLLADSILRAAEIRHDQRFEWYHFGDGPQRTKIAERMQTDAPANVTAHLPGYPGLPALLAHYRDRPVDLFVNVSESEGTPVAVMEAVSCGIPVLATAVGGNREIVSENNGVLVSPDPDPGEIARAILGLVDDPVASDRKREGSRAVWEQRFDAATNYDALVELLETLRLDMGAFPRGDAYDRGPARATGPAH